METFHVKKTSTHTVHPSSSSAYPGLGQRTQNQKSLSQGSDENNTLVTGHLIKPGGSAWTV